MHGEGVSREAVSTEDPAESETGRGAAKLEPPTLLFTLRH